MSGALVGLKPSREPCVRCGTNVRVFTVPTRTKDSHGRWRADTKEQRETHECPHGIPCVVHNRQQHPGTIHPYVQCASCATLPPWRPEPAASPLDPQRGGK